MPHKGFKIISVIAKILNCGIGLSLIVYIYCYYKIKDLPGSDLISKSLYSDPVQEPTDTQPFTFEYEGHAYTVLPVADYSISGVVVTHNNISGIDIYHTSKSVDFKDLCVVWGDNLKSNIYKEFKYWSEPWTCNFQTGSNEAFENFRLDQLSNNHLLTDNLSIRDEIRKVKVGDQVHFEGMLVKYYPKGEPDLVRNTSTIRTDTGNGACEVVFVKSFTKVKEWLPTYSMFYRTAKGLFFCLLIIKVISLVVFPVIEYRLM